MHTRFRVAKVIGGVVPMGQAFLELGAGHLPKSDASPTQESATRTLLSEMDAARQRSEGCNPTHPRPHYALVGTADDYYGEDAGVYRGSALWERYSTTVLGCTASPGSSNESG